MCRLLLEDLQNISSSSSPDVTIQEGRPKGSIIAPQKIIQTISMSEWVCVVGINKSDDVNMKQMSYSLSYQFAKSAYETKFFIAES